MSRRLRGLMLPLIASSVAFVAVNLWGARWNHRIDLTSAGVYSLSPETVATATAIDTPVDILFFMDGRSQQMRDAAALLAQLADVSPKISLRTADPFLEPALAERHDVRFAGTTVYRSAGRRIVSYGGTETDFVNSLIRATRKSGRLVCFSDGHVEGDPESFESHDHSESQHGHSHSAGGRPLRVHERHGFGMARGALEVLGYSVEKRNLLSGEAPLEDCPVLVIASPQVPFLEREVEVLRNYLERAGSLLLLTEPGVPTGLEALLADYGLAVSTLPVLDHKRHYGTDSGAPAVAEYPRHQITRDLPLTFFPGAAALLPRTEGAQLDSVVTPLVISSEDSSLGETEARDRSILAAYVVAEREEGTTRLLVVGDGDFATNSYFAVLGNGQLFLNAVNVLSDESSMLELSPRNYQQATVALTNRQMLATFVLSTLLLPACLALFGMRMYWRGR